MSNINKSRNLFLEKEELVRLDKFFFEDGIEDYRKRTTKTGGIVPSQSGTIGDNFKFIQGSDYTKIKLTEDSIAYNTQGKRIFYAHQSNYEWKAPQPINPATTKESWAYIEHTTTPIEEGTVTLSANGAVTGIETKFTEVFRGESTLVPNKIRIYERTALEGSGSGYTYTLSGTYEVTEITNNTTMFINAITALPAGTYAYSVVGAFSPGTFDDTREEEIYSYDFVNVVFSDTDPTGTLTDDQYLLCKITIDTLGVTQTIEDLRSSVFIITYPYYSKDTDIDEWELNKVKIQELDSLKHKITGATITASSTTLTIPEDNYKQGIINIQALASGLEIEKINYNNITEGGREIVIYNVGSEDIDFTNAGSQPLNIVIDAGTVTLKAGQIMKMIFGSDFSWLILHKSL